METVKYINDIKKDAIYFFVDDSGTLLSDKQQNNLKEKFQNKESKVNNDLKAFSVTAVCLTKKPS